MVRGLVALAAALAFVALAVTANKGVPGKPYKTVYVKAPDVGSLRQHDKVSIGGVRVGQVVTTTPSTDGARVQLQIEPDADLKKGTKVVIRANGLLGARYVQLIPGKGAELASGSTLVAGDKDLTFTVPNALDTFDKETRGALGTSVRGLGEGFLGNGEKLNTGIRRSSHATIPFQKIMRAITAREGSPERLVPGLESGVGALNRNRNELGQMMEPLNSTLSPLVDQRPFVQDTLDVAPSALFVANYGLGRGINLLRAADSLATSASRTLPEAPKGLRATTRLLRYARTPTSKGGKSPLQRTNRLVRQVPPVVPAVLKVTKNLKPVLPRANAALTKLRPIINTAAPYGCDFINFGIVFRSMTGYVGTGSGPNGPLSQFRLQALGAPETLQIKDPNGTRDAYPAPCKYSPGREFPLPSNPTGGGGF